MSDTATLKLPKDLVEASIEKALREAVAVQLVDKDLLIQKIAREILNEKVDSSGKPSRYSSAEPFLEWACSEKIREALMEVFQEELEKRKGLLKEALRAELQKKNSPIVKSLINATAEGLIDATKNRWKFNLQIKNEV